MVSGFLSLSVQKTSTSSLPEYPASIDADAKLGHDEDKSALIENAHEMIDVRQETFTHYIAEEDWDLFFEVFMMTDRVNHFGAYDHDGEYKT